MLISVVGTATILQEITPDDAQLICDLRNDPKINRFLSSTEKTTVEQQKAWTIKNSKKVDDFYFKIVDKKTGEFCGTVAIYDKEHNAAEFGRYVCTKPLQSVESELLILQFGFEAMCLDKLYARVVKENKYVWNQHYKYGFKDIGEEIIGPRQMLHINQELDKTTFRNFDYSFIDKLISRLQ